MNTTFSLISIQSEVIVHTLHHESYVTFYCNNSVTAIEMDVNAFHLTKNFAS